MEGIVHRKEATLYQELMRLIGYNFKDESLLIQALTHASYINEHPELREKDNERLEFLGDAVLDLVVGDLLYSQYPDADEGILSRFRAALVDEKGLFNQAQKIALGRFLLLGKGEEQNNGRQKPSILSGAFEALMGALYLDGGYGKAYRVIRRLFEKDIRDVHNQVASLDYKTTLQEYTQAQYKCLPEYRTVEEEGPPHDRRFKVLLMLLGKTISQGEGKSKKEAEQEAAREALNWLRKKGDL
jgi:ribonuclease III